MTSTEGKSGMHMQRKLLIVSGLVGISATFMPWIHAPIIGAFYGTDGDGWITLALFLPALIFSFLGESGKPVGGGKRIGITISAILVAVIGIYKIIDIKSIASGAGGESNPLVAALQESFKPGFGLYVVIAAGIAVPLVAWICGKKSAE